MESRVKNKVTRWWIILFLIIALVISSFRVPVSESDLAATRWCAFSFRYVIYVNFQANHVFKMSGIDVKSFDGSDFDVSPEALLSTGGTWSSSGLVIRTESPDIGLYDPDEPVIKFHSAVWGNLLLFDGRYRIRGRKVIWFYACPKAQPSTLRNRNGAFFEDLGQVG